MPDDLEPGTAMEHRLFCPDCGSDKLDPPDEMGWRFCRNCQSDFAADYDPLTDPGDDDLDDED